MASDDLSYLRNSIKSSKSYGSTYPNGMPKEVNQSAMDYSLFSNLAKSLRFRHDLYEYRKFTSKFTLILGIFGLALAILENHISTSFIQPTQIQKNYLVSFVIRFSITLTTIILIILILIYHNIDLQVEMQRYNISDWKLALSYRRIIKLITEIVICSFQPLPVSYKTIYYPRFLTLHSTYDEVMTILMFLRFYLLARVLILRSNLHQDVTAQSFGAINQTSVNTKFIFKSWMSLYSIHILIILIIFILIWGSWATTVCEPTFSFSDSMWFTAITFLSIGYGDIIPHSHCGRAVAMLTGVLGAGCTALVVAIISRNLALSQSEKYLHNFVQDSQLKHKLKGVSTNIIKYAWTLFKAKRLQHVTGRKSNSVLFNKRNLLYNIRQVRDIRMERRQLKDSSISLLEVSQAQAHTQTVMEKMDKDISKIEARLQIILTKLNTQ